jgi:hypothetical protein
MADLRSMFAESVKVYNKTMYDQIFGNSPLLAFLRAKNRISTFEGSAIVERIQLGKNTSVDYRDAKAQISTTSDDPFAQVQWLPKTLDGAVELWAVDDWRNSGAAQISNLFEDLLQNLQDSLSEKMNNGVYASGGATLWDGLEAICATGNVYGSIIDTSGNFSGFDRAATGATSAAAATWRSIVDTTTGAVQIVSGANSIVNMLFKTASGVAGTKADLIVTTPALWSTINATMATQQRYESKLIGSLGFDSVAVNNVPVIADDYCPSGTIYVLNSKYLKLRVHPKCLNEFILTDKLQIADYLKMVQLCALYANMTCVMPRAMGKMTGRT